MLYENTVLQWKSFREQLDCMHWFSGTISIINLQRTVVTIHDLFAFRKDVGFSLIKRLYLKVMNRHAMKNADFVLPVSRSTADEIVGRIGNRGENILVLHTVLRPEFKAASEAEIAAVRIKYDLPLNFWLYIAVFHTRKNHLGLLKAYRRLKKTGHRLWRLVFRGDEVNCEASIRRYVTENALEEDVIFLPRMEYGELPALYSASSALIFPSFYEGGGIPVLEAMACGCPVAASSLPSVREFCGDAALYFDPGDPDEIANAMKRMQEDRDLRIALIDQGTKRAGLFREGEIVPKLLRVYAQIMQGR